MTKMMDDPTRSWSTEWLLTNGLGGFAMGTTPGAATRRYHGMLIAATLPPVGRIVAVQQVIDEVQVGALTIHLASQDFGDPPCAYVRGMDRLVAVERTADGVRWTWRLNELEITRTIAMIRERNAARLTWSWTNGDAPAVLKVRPLTPLRDFHAFEREHAGAEYRIDQVDPQTLHVTRGDLTLRLGASIGDWVIQPDWWRRLAYTVEQQRGLDWHDDVWTPGAVEVALAPHASGTLTLDAEVIEPLCEADLPDLDDVAPGDDLDSRLRLAADQFIVRRVVDGQVYASVIAGYPWFGDWGRDTMIAFDGLFLATGRHEEARSVLTLFARHLRGGLIPNRFDDRGGEPEYNTVDAALWFVHAVGRYVEVTGDRDVDDLIDACRAIVAAYRAGTSFGIHADTDGLIVAGDASTQLTWMDAKRDGIVFTPRHGKAVEINALWHHGLRVLADLVDGAEREPLRRLADDVADAFVRAFWWPERECLHDVLVPDGSGGWRPDGHLRPNQVFAASLPHSPLSPAQRGSVLRAVRSDLLTPFGLRTLAPWDSAYRGRYSGSLLERDAAYHQGTVWPWLIGAYAEAAMRVDAGESGRRMASAAIEPLLRELDRGCLGQVAEVYDGDPPHRADGCPAQAWSIAELLRIRARLAAPSPCGCGEGGVGG
ncbi:MAG: glycogen debranching enzyme family protein [Phycisphaerales bacterium]|nr:glycogen debranching enzyme family protein [Phycisphaerales bacterium]